MLINAILKKLRSSPKDAIPECGPIGVQQLFLRVFPMTLCRSRRRQVVEMYCCRLICWAHNPKVGGSNPPPATNSIIGLQAKLLFPAGAKRGIIGCFGGLFHLASLSAGRSAICTTLLLAARFDSIMASP